MSLAHILAPPEESTPPPPSRAKSPLPPTSQPTSMPAPISSQHSQHELPDDNAANTPQTDAGGDEPTGTGEPSYTSTTTSTRRNASGSVSSVYSGNKIKHLKKEDGIPLWRKDIQYDFLRLVFHDPTRCFTKYSDKTGGHTFSEVYIDAMAKSSKCSKILKEKLLQDQDGAMSMAMVCLLVNVGRMNTTLNFFPEMRAQLRTYHSIPALQAHQDPNAYKQLQDAPRLKSILKGATEDEPQPSTVEEIRSAKRPRTNPVNLIFVMSQYAPKISEVHFQSPRDFFDLVVRSSLSSTSRARAFLWLIWWYLESDFGYEDSQRNPFGPGLYGDGEQGTDALPVKVPLLESLTEDQAAAENLDTEDEMHFGEVKRKERIAILASEPSPAMTALKRARKEKGITSGPGGQSDDETSEFGYAGWRREQLMSAGRSHSLNHDTGSDHTRSPSPAARSGFQPVNLKPADDMRINNLLNDDGAGSRSSPAEAPAPPPPPPKKGPGRGNWRRNKPKPDASVPLAARPTEDRTHPIPLLPNTSTTTPYPPDLHQLPNTPTAHPLSTLPSQHTHSHPPPFALTSSAYGPSTSAAGAAGPHDAHVPTPSYQSQKRSRGVTQHQSAIITHRKQQIDYHLDRRIRHVHGRKRREREDEGPVVRAWKRVRVLPAEYDSEEEGARVARGGVEPGEEEGGVKREGEGRGGAGAGTGKGGKGGAAGSAAGGGVKDGPEAAAEEQERLRQHPSVFMGGYGKVDGEAGDVGEEAKTLARVFRLCSRRLVRWTETDMPGEGMLRRRRREEGGELEGEEMGGRALREESEGAESDGAPAAGSAADAAAAVAAAMVPFSPASAGGRRRGGGGATAGKRRGGAGGRRSTGVGRGRGRGRGRKSAPGRGEERDRDGESELVVQKEPEQEGREILGDADGNREGGNESDDDKDEDMGGDD